MSTKDVRFKRNCPICGESLPGTDDGEQVFDCLKSAVANGYEPGCDLCGETVSLDEAKAIIAKGAPKLLMANGDDVL